VTVPSPTGAPDPNGGLCIEHLDRQFGRFYALRDVTLTIRPGQTLTIFGNNGAGKTTLLRTTAGLLAPSGGRVTFQGKDVFADNAPYRRAVGLLSHESFLYNDLTATENLAFFGRLYDVPDLPARIGEMLDRVGLSRRSQEPIRSFSRGMHQRLALARAFLHDPQIALLDEPWSGLDQRSAAMLSDLLREFQGRDRAAILTTHDLERGLALATHVAILERGSVVYEAEGSQDPAHFRELYQSHVR